MRELVDSAARIACCFMLMCLAICCVSQVHAATYYVDADTGRDSQSGLSPDHAWQTLEKVNAAHLLPGDAVLFKRGQAWIGQLTPQNSGSAGKRIRYAAYGQGHKPRLIGGKVNGGSVRATIFVHNQDHLEIHDLDVRNERTTRLEGVRDDEANAILVVNDSQRSMVDYHLEGLVVEAYSITLATFDFNYVAGISFHAQAVGHAFKDITIRNTQFNKGTRFGALIMACYPHQASATTKNERRVSRYCTSQGGEGSDYDPSNPETFVQNLIFENNTCNYTGGSCFMGRRLYNAKIRNNLIDHPGAPVANAKNVAGRGSGGWIANCENILIEGNKIYGAHGSNDSSWFHLDGGNAKVLMQYNFGYGAQGAGLQILGANRDVVVRYNIAIDNGIRPTFAGMIFIGDYVPDAPFIFSERVFVYNNTFSFSKAKTNLQFQLFAKHAVIYNNIISAEGEARISPLNLSPKSENNRVFNNLWNNADENIVSLDTKAIVGDPGFNLVENQDRKNPLNYRIDSKSLAYATADRSLLDPFQNPDFFPALGTGFFSDTARIATRDFFGHAIPRTGGVHVGAGQGNN